MNDEEKRDQMQAILGVLSQKCKRQVRFSAISGRRRAADNLISVT